MFYYSSYVWFDNFFSSIPSSILNFATIVPFFMSVISFIIQWLEIGENLSSLFIVRFCADVRFMMFVLMLLLFTFIQRKNKKESDTVGKQYYKFLHDFRNEISDFEVLLYNRKATLKTIQLLVKGLIRSSLDNLCEIYSIHTGQQVFGCVKMLEPEEGKIVLENARVQTFERSGNASPARYVIDVKEPIQMVLDNTDFCSIINGEMDNEKSVFYQPNLVEFEKKQKAQGKEYKNTNKSWKKYYMATIVAPIRIANRRNPYVQTNTDYTTMGFICVDSMSTSAFPLGQKEYFTNIIKSYAALLYILLYKYKSYLKREEEEKLLDVQETHVLAPTTAVKKSAKKKKKDIQNSV